MSHKNKKSLVDQVKQSLDSKLAIGRSKHQDKLSENERKEITSNYIYSWETYRSYLKHGCYFVLWCKEKSLPILKTGYIRNYTIFIFQ